MINWSQLEGIPFIKFSIIVIIGDNSSIFPSIRGRRHLPKDLVMMTTYPQRSSDNDNFCDLSNFNSTLFEPKFKSEVCVVVVMEAIEEDEVKVVTVGGDCGHEIPFQYYC